MSEPIQDPKDPYLVEARHSMRCLLSVAVQEAVTLALIDTARPRDANGQDRFWTDDEKLAMRRNIYAMPDEALGNMDPGALARNVACRLLGTGGWIVGGVYAGNATPREVFEATIERPDRSFVDELAFDTLAAFQAPDDEDDG